MMTLLLLEFFFLLSNGVFWGKSMTNPFFEYFHSIVSPGQTCKLSEFLPKKPLTTAVGVLFLTLTFKLKVCEFLSQRLSWAKAYGLIAQTSTTARTALIVFLI